MVVSITANSGQDVIFSINVVDGYGQLADGYQSAEIVSILSPSLVPYVGFPAFMTKISTGRYYSSITLPNGSSYLGTYQVLVRWPHPTTRYFQYELFLINSNLPFGNSAVYPA